MKKESFVIGETILRLVKENKLSLIEVLIKRLKEEQEINVLREVIDYLEAKNNQLKGRIVGKLYLAFEEKIEDLKELLERKINSKIEIKDKIRDEKLILGGIFISNNFVLDFSLRGVFKNFFKQWKI